MKNNKTRFISSNIVNLFTLELVRRSNDENFISSFVLNGQSALIFLGVTDAGRDGVERTAILKARSYGEDFFAPPRARGQNRV